MKSVNQIFKQFGMGAVFVCLLALSACSGGGGSSSSAGTGGSSSGGSAAAGFVKLTSGNTWSYNVSNVITVYPYNSNTGTKTRVMSTTANGSTLTDTETLSVGTPTIASYYFSVASNGDIMMTYDPTVAPGIYIVANPALNATWSGNGGTATVKSTTASVTVPAGTFNNCIQVEVVSGVGTGTWYFSTTVGNYVKHVMTTSSGTHTEELTSYTAI
jgi:hypothetical protein